MNKKIRNGQKTEGTLFVKPFKLALCFLDATNLLTKQEVTFVLRRPVSEAMKDYLQSLINSNRGVNVLCRRREDGMFDYIKIVHPKAGIGRRNRMMKRIAHESMMREVEIDWNPVRGKGRQKLLTGRAGIPTSNNTSGKIGSALIKNIKREHID